MSHTSPRRIGLARCLSRAQLSISAPRTTRKKSTCLAAIAAHYGVSFKELTEGGLQVLPLLGKDATLCAVTKGGNVEVTGLYRQIYEAAGDIKPKNISI